LRVFFLAILALVALDATPVMLGAQQASSVRVAQFASAALDGGAYARSQVPVAGTKSAVAAGLLSLGLPGVGSFYAGNRRHGWRHLAIHGVSIAVVAASCLPGLDNCNGAGGIATWAFLGNLVWAPITAVRDAHAANARRP
jgi:hypothetical protein